MSGNEHIQRAFGSTDLVFGAALSAFLGLSVAQQTISNEELIYLGIGLASLAFAIANTQSDVLRSRLSLSGRNDLFLSLLGFGAAAFSLTQLSAQTSVILTILGVWGLMYIALFVTNLYVGRMKNE